MTMSYEFSVVQFALAEQLMEGKKYVAVFTELNVYFVKFLFLKMPYYFFLSLTINADNFFFKEIKKEWLVFRL